MRLPFDDIRTSPKWHFAGKIHFVDQKLNFWVEKWPFFGFFNFEGLYLNRGCSERHGPGRYFCSAHPVACIEGFVRFLAQILVKKIKFFCAFFCFSGPVSAVFRHFFKNDLHRGQPLPKFITAQTIWHVSRVFSFLGLQVEK